MQRSKLIALAILLISAISACTKKTDNPVRPPWGNYVHEEKRWNSSDTTTTPFDTTFSNYAVFIPYDTLSNPW